MKKKIFSKVLALLLVFAMALTTACSKNVNNTGNKVNDAGSGTPTTAAEGNMDGAEIKDDNTNTGTERSFNEDGTYPVCKEKTTLKVLIAENSNVEDYETNRMTQLIEEYGNFDLEFTVLPTAEFKTKVNLMAIGGEELPDIIITNSSCRFSDTEVYNLALSGAIVPLTEYYDNAYFIKESIERTGTDYLPMITSPDGEIYGVASYNQSISNENPSKMWVYQPWLDALNLEVPTTTEEFYQMLKAFKDKDPNGNGLNDEMPLVYYNSSAIYWFMYLMNPFTYTGMNSTDWLVVEEDGSLSVSYNKEEYREGLRYLKKLVDEDLFSPLSFTQDSAAFKALLANEETIVGAFAKAGPSDLPADDIRRTEYVAIPPLTGDNGTSYAMYQPGVPYIDFVVTRDCENPEAAFKLGDLLVNEEFSIMTRWGEKGIDWLEPSAGDVSLYDEIGYGPSLVEVLPWGQLQNQHWAGTGPYVRQYSISAGVVWGGDTLDTAPAIAKGQILYMGHNPENVVAKLIYTSEESEQISEIQATLKSYTAECRSAFLTGNMDIEADWDTYIGQLETIGLSSFLEVAQAAYDRMYK